MKRFRFIRQTLDILLKIISAFIIVFIMYFVSSIVNNFAYDYFIFPLISITVIFVCGINVGRSLEKMKTNESIGYFTKKGMKRQENNDLEDRTEFIVGDSIRISTNKKVLKEVKEGNKVHIKVMNYNDIYKEEESEQ